MSRPTDSRAVSLTRATGIDIAMLLFGGAAIVMTFFTGQGVPRWQNLVFAPIVVLLAAITLRLAIAEFRALGPEMPNTPHKGEALTALLVAIVMTIVIVPMLAIMPLIWLGALFS